MRRLIITTIFAIVATSTFAQYTVRFTDLIGATTDNNGIVTKTSASGSWINMSATSSNYLAPNTDGSIQFTITTQKQVQVGFITNNFGDPNTSVFANAMGVGANDAIWTYEGTTFTSTFGNYASGDVFKIERVGSQVNYRRNGTTIRTVTVNPALQLWVRLNIYNNLATSPAVTATFDARVLIFPRVIGTRNGASTGSVKVKAEGGKAPYTFSWNTGQTVDSIGGLGLGTRTVTVTDADGRTATSTVNIAYKVLYKTLFTANDANGILTRNGGTGWSSGGDGSNLSFSDGTYIEFTVTDYTSFYAIGFGAYADYSGASFRGGIMINTNRTFAILELGSLVTVGAYRVGDVFKVYRQGTVLKFSKNGQDLSRQTASASATFVFPKVSIYQGSTPPIVSSQDARIVSTADVKGTGLTNGTGSISVSPSGGLAPYTYLWKNSSNTTIGTTSQLNNLDRGAYALTITDAEGRTMARTYSIGYNQVYTSIVNATESDGVISRPTTGWIGGGATANVLPMGVNGWFEFVIPTIAGTAPGSANSFMIGAQGSEDGWTTTDFRNAFYVAASPAVAQIGVYEYSTSSSGGTYEPGDVLRIERSGTTLTYSVNGTPIRTLTNFIGDIRLRSSVGQGMAPRIQSSFDTKVLVSADVIGTAVADNTGSITTSVIGGTPPYTYSWTGGGGTGSSISGKPRGSYNVTVTDAAGRQTTRSYEIKYAGSWMNATSGLTPTGTGNGLTRAGQGYDQGVNSSNLVPANEDAWVEFVVNSSKSTYGVGFSWQDNATDPPSAFKYGILISSNGAVTLYEQSVGTNAGNFTVGDVFRITRANGNITYTKNGTVLSSVTRNAGVELKGKVILYTGSTPPIMYSHPARLFPVAAITNTEQTDNTGAISLSTMGGTPPYSYAWTGMSDTTRTLTSRSRGSYQVTVTDALGRTIVKNYSIGYKQHYTSRKGATENSVNGLDRIFGSGWGMGANSVNTLPAGTDGFIEWVVTDQKSIYAVGFGKKLGGLDVTDFYHSLYVHSLYGTLTIYNQTSPTSYSNGIQVGDVLRIARTGSTVYYYRNGIQIWSAPATVGDLSVKVAVYYLSSPSVATEFDTQLKLSTAIVGTGVNGNDGSITTKAYGGKPPYTYSWLSGETTPGVSGKTGGEYTINVTDADQRQVAVTHRLGKRPTWGNLSSVTMTPTKTLVRTGAAGWNGGAYTLPPLASGADGWIEFVIPDSVSTFVTGFATNITDYSLNGFTYGVLVDPSTSSLTAREGAGGTYLCGFQPGDRIRIERAGTSIKYWKNNLATPLRTLTVNKNIALRVKTSVNTGTATPVMSSFEIDDLAVAIDNWGFQYQYDGRKRMTAKKVPGADWVYMVYDNRDRLVLTQDGNQRALNQWLFTKYDVLNRPIMTGIRDTTLALTQQQMQAVVDAHYTKPSSKWGETYIGSATGNVHGYSNASYPKVTDVFWALTLSYYDSYDWLATVNSGSLYQFSPDEFPGEAEAPATTMTLGLATGSKTRVLDGGPMYLVSAPYYDDKGRVVQTVSDNFKMGIDRVTNILDFTGKVMKSKSVQSTADLAWREKQFIAEQGRLFKNISASPGFQYCGMVSQQSLPANTDGWIEMVVDGFATRFGFNPFTVNAYNLVEMDYGIEVTTGGATIIAKGVNKSNVAGVTKRGDVIRITRTGSTVTFSRNGQPLVVTTTFAGTGSPNPVTNASTGALMTDVELYAIGGTAGPIRVSPSMSGQSISVLREFVYDHAGRMMREYHTIGSGARVLMVDNKYNELGQLIDKNLHSTDNGATSRQSIDYRYNIRGWLTSINGAELVQDSRNNDATGQRRDLFGMDLLYNGEVSGLNDGAGLYNGNISAMRWSKNQGLDTVKQNAYKYSYDPMNRITAAAFKQKAAGWTASASYSETGYSYDLNGNILGLVRNDKAGAQMDNMSYSYGDLSVRSNRLLRVTDSGNKSTGFIDGANTDDDYSYDVNGNMVADKNKSIASISYNHLNLPTVVTKSTGDAVRYYYDATGRKLMQDVVTSAWARTKRSEYNGEMFFENDTLKFLNTEEGRAIAEGTWSPAPQLLVDPDMTNANAAYAFGPATLAAVTLNGETYIRSTANQANSASGYLSPPVTTTPMRQYTLKVKGYRTSAALAKIYVQSVGSVSGSLVEPGPVLPTAEGWISVTFTAPSTATYIKVGVLVYSPAVGDQFFLNRMELYEYNGGQGNMVFAQNGNFTYQYHLKDHLGNVRLTFTTKDEKDISKATMETANSNTEQGQFLYYDEAVKVNSKIFDHTDVGPTWYSTRLNGSTNERFGLAKSLSVMPGDTVRAAVYAKYLDPDSSNWTVELAGFIHSFGNGAPAGTFIDGGLLGSTGGVTIPFAGALNKSNETGSAPKAYLNYIVFDRDFNFKDGGYVRVTTAAREYGRKGPHEELAKELVITEPGYVYLYISNDNVSLGGGEVEVYWDDFKVEHVKSPVIQSDSYYPFGLRYDSYSRENSLSNKAKLFQGQEHADELGLNWDSFKWRNHQPEIGRFFNVDPLSEKFYYNSSYAFSENKVTRHVELEGLEAFDIVGAAMTIWNAITHPVNTFNSTQTGQGLQNINQGIQREAGSKVDQALNGGQKIQDAVNEGGSPQKVLAGYQNEQSSGRAQWMKGMAQVAIASGEMQMGLFSGAMAPTSAPASSSNGVNIENAVWSQKTFSSTFSESGTLSGKTVSGVVESLRNGSMTAAQVPVNVVVRNGQTFILNTRSSAALTQAGIPRSGWNVVNQTGNASFEKMLTGQLTRNNLTTGTNVIKQTGTNIVITY